MTTKMFDSYQVNDVLTVADRFAADGFKAAAVYLFRASGFKEGLTRQNVAALSEKFFVVTVYENGSPTSGGYFTSIRGQVDAAAAFSEAAAIGQPQGTVVYFAVDYDAAESDLPGIGLYFAQIAARAKAAGYKVGVYGSGRVCDFLARHGLAAYTWLSQSKGFAGYEEWLPKANIVQGAEANLHGINTDLDTSAGNGGGWKISPPA